MCGSFQLELDPDEFEMRFGVSVPTALQGQMSLGDIFPRRPILGLRHNGERMEAAAFEWGVPLPSRKGRSKDLINARAENLITSSMWRPMMMNGRVLVPATSFYEWTQVDEFESSRPREKFRFSASEPFAMAGVATRKPYTTDDGVLHEADALVIVTTEPNDDVSPIHPRMPAIVPKSGWETWLDPSSDPEDMASRLVPFAASLSRELA
jgi:putative SOS response-associated peptidase YedK